MTPSNYQRTRWLTLIGTIITQFALGSVYTWSLFNGALSAKLDAPVSQVAFSFGLLSLGLAISSSVAGKLQERFGVKRVTMASGILLGLGFFLTAHSDNLMMLWLSAGVLVGLADGAGYLLTLSNCVKWFPERKGLISAFAIGSYGLGSLGFKFIDTQLLETVGLEKTFVIWGAIALVGMAALLFAPLNAVTFFAAIACVAFNFGGTITVFPSLVSEFFGLNNLAKNYGVIYLGFGIGSICGSIIASLFGGFYVTFYVIFALLILSLALSTTIRQPEQKMLREAHGSL